MNNLLVGIAGLVIFSSFLLIFLRMCGLAIPIYFMFAPAMAVNLVFVACFIAFQINKFIEVRRNG